MNNITHKLWGIVGASFILAFIFSDVDLYTSEAIQEVSKSWIQIAALAVSAGLSVAKGIRQKKAAKDLERQNVRPQARISRGTMNNIAISRQAAQEGLPEQTYNRMLDNLNLTTSSALRNNLLYSGRNVNTNAIARARNEGLSELASQDAQARDRNRSQVMRANQDLAREEREIYAAEMQQYGETANRVASLRGAGDSNIYSGIGGVLSAAASGAFNNLGGGTGLGVKATPPGANPTPSEAMSMSKAAIGEGLGNNFNSAVRSSLSGRVTLQGDNAFWRNAGRLR